MNAKWHSIKVGDTASFETVFDVNRVDDFVRVSHDDNRLHVDGEFAKGRGFEGRVVHGMLLASCFSKLVGGYFLEEDNLYLSQTINFKKAVIVGEKVKVEGTVVSKSDSTRTLEIATIIYNSLGEKVVVGTALVRSTYI